MNEHQEDLAWIVVGVPRQDLRDVIAGLGEHVLVVHGVDAIVTNLPRAQHLEESVKELQFDSSMVSFYPGSSPEDLTPVVTKEDLGKFALQRDYSKSSANRIIDGLHSIASKDAVSPMLYSVRRGEMIFRPVGIRVDSLLNFVEQLESGRIDPYNVGHRSISLLRDFCSELFSVPNEQEQL